MHIFIAESDRNLRVGLQMLLNQEAGMQVTGIAVRTETLAAQVAAAQTDVLLVDWHLPGGLVSDVLAELRQSVSPPKIIVMSVRPEMERAALAAGADAFVSIGASPEHLIAALRSLNVTDEMETKDEFDPAQKQ